jgi:hypothetical protein
MNEIIYGNVTKIVDKNTIQIELTFEVSNNHFVYNSTEKIKLLSLLTPNQTKSKRKFEKEELEKYLIGQEVECHIHGRDNMARLVAEVIVVEKVYQNIRGYDNILGRWNP